MALWGPIETRREPFFGVIDSLGGDNGDADRFHANAAGVDVDLRTEYRYDPFGNRVARIVDSDGDGFVGITEQLPASATASSEWVGYEASNVSTLGNWNAWIPSNEVAGETIIATYEHAAAATAVTVYQLTDYNWVTRIEVYDLDESDWVIVWDDQTPLAVAGTVSFPAVRTDKVRVTVDASASSTFEAPVIDAIKLHGTASRPKTITQYASTVIGYSSQYSSTNWSAAQALGAPDTLTYGDIETAWAAYFANSANEYLSVGFATPVYATGVTVRETNGNGFVTQIDVIDMNDTLHTVWTGTDTSAPGAPVDFYIGFTKTTYLVKGVKIHVNGLATTTWEEIDAVTLHGHSDAAAVTTLFTLDMWNPAKSVGIGLENTDVYADHVDGSLTSRYLRGDGVDELLGRFDLTTYGGQTIGRKWTLTDNQGSIRAVLSGTASILARTDYDAFGNRKTLTGSSSNPEAELGRYQWTGREYDPAAETYDLRGRTYGPDLGRFFQKDPIGFRAGDSILYRYVTNGPTNGTDPSGLDEIQDRINSFRGSGLPDGPSYDTPIERARRRERQQLHQQNQPANVNLPAIPVVRTTRSASVVLALPLAGIASAGDGPFPIGDAIGLAILVLGIFFLFGK